MTEKRFPWYDAEWLNTYLRAKNVIRKIHPNKLAAFDELLAPLRTRLDFEPIQLTGFLTEQFLQESKEFIANLSNDKKETHEVFRFGRVILHNSEFFNSVHDSITERVSELVGEEVEPSYNFLSLYYNLGICEVHMDAPHAKYTVDLLIEQTVDWPIFISNWQGWVEDVEMADPNWQKRVKNDPKINFTSYSLKPGGGVIFSGSSSWHYRDAIYGTKKANHCHLIFFHFIPKGTKEILDPRNWERLLDLSELNYEVPSFPPS